jgi:hydrogenase/urease accessory protein HupE
MRAGDLVATLATRLLLAVALLLAAPAAAAHPFQVSGLDVEVRDAGVAIAHDLDARTLLDLLPLDADGDGQEAPEEILAARPRIVAYLDEHLSLSRGGERCALEPPTRFELGRGARLLVARQASCPGSGRLRIELDALMEDAGGHRHVGIVRAGTLTARHDFLPDRTVFEFDPSSEPASDEPAAPPASTSLLGWLRQGGIHVLAGADHMLFVLGLVLGVRRVRELVVLVTAFTLSHTLALALGALELVQPPARLVESLIALSVLWVSAENALSRAPRARARPWLTLGFGLVHGLAFGSALRELGAAGAGLALPLLGFNLGVEIGQLVVVIPTFFLLGRLGQKPQLARRVRMGAGAACALVAAIWLLERAAGLELVPG